MKNYTFPITEEYPESAVYTQIQEWLSANNNPLHTLIKPDQAIVMILEDDTVAARFESTWTGPPYI